MVDMLRFNIGYVTINWISLIDMLCYNIGYVIIS